MKRVQLGSSSGKKSVGGGSASKRQKDDLKLLKITNERLNVFLEGLDNYEFQIFQHPADYREPIETKQFFEHFYGVIRMFVSQDNDELSLGRILVLYGVDFMLIRFEPLSRS